MSTSTQKINHELINIQVAIELDKGRKITEVAEKFGLNISAVKAVAKKLASENTFFISCHSIKRVLSIAKEGHLVKKVLTMYKKRFYLNGSVIH